MMIRIIFDVPVIIATAVARETGMTFSIDSEKEKLWIRADSYLEKGIRADQLSEKLSNSAMEQ